MEFLARREVTAGVQDAEVDDVIVLPAGPTPNWEDVDGGFVTEDWDIGDRRLVTAR